MTIMWLLVSVNHFYRLCYGEWVLEKFNLKNSEGCNVYLMYDIACTLHKHLKVSVSGFTQLQPFLVLLLQKAGMTELVEKVKLCLPLWSLCFMSSKVLHSFCYDQYAVSKIYFRSNMGH